MAAASWMKVLALLLLLLLLTTSTTTATPATMLLLMLQIYSKVSANYSCLASKSSATVPQINFDTNTRQRANNAKAIHATHDATIVTCVSTNPSIMSWSPAAAMSPPQWLLRCNVM